MPDQTGSVDNLAHTASTNNNSDNETARTSSTREGLCEVVFHDVEVLTFPALGVRITKVTTPHASISTGHDSTVASHVRLPVPTDASVHVNLEKASRDVVSYRTVTLGPSLSQHREAQGSIGRNGVGLLDVNDEQADHEAVRGSYYVHRMSHGAELSTNYGDNDVSVNVRTNRLGTLIQGYNVSERLDKAVTVLKAGDGEQTSGVERPQDVAQDAPSKRLKNNDGHAVAVQTSLTTSIQTTAIRKRHGYYPSEPDPADFHGGSDSQEFEDAMVWYWHAVKGVKFDDMSSLFEQKWGRRSAEGVGTSALRRRYSRVLKLINETADSHQDDGKKGSSQEQRDKSEEVNVKPDKVRKNTGDHITRKELVYQWRKNENLSWHDMCKRLEDDYGLCVTIATLQSDFYAQKTVVAASANAAVASASISSSAGSLATFADSAAGGTESIAESGPARINSIPSATNLPAVEADVVDFVDAGFELPPPFPPSPPGVQM
jgi:hypothetical protein